MWLKFEHNSNSHFYARLLLAGANFLSEEQFQILQKAVAIFNSQPQDTLNRLCLLLTANCSSIARDLDNIILHHIQRCSAQELKDFEWPTDPIDVIKDFPKPLQTSKYMTGDETGWWYLLPLDGTEDGGICHCLKLFPYPCDQGALPQFLAERHLMQSIHHPYILSILTTGTITYQNQSLPYYISEYCGKNLFDLIEIRYTLTSPQILNLIRQLAQGLEALHQAGYIHGALSPQTILFSYDDLPKIQCTHLHTQRSEFLLSLYNHPEFLAYTAPEQYVETIWDERIDVFCLGLILYEIVIGTPFVASGPKQQGWKKHYSSLAKIQDKAFYQLCSHMLAPYPHRLQNMSEVLNEIDSLSSNKIAVYWVIHNKNKIKNFMQSWWHLHKLNLVLQQNRELFFLLYPTLQEIYTNTNLVALPPERILELTNIAPQKLAPLLTTFLNEFSLPQLQQLADILLQQMPYDWMLSLIRHMPISTLTHPSVYFLIGLWISKNSQGDLSISESGQSLVIENCTGQSEFINIIKERLCCNIWDENILEQVNLLIEEKRLTNAMLIERPQLIPILMIVQIHLTRCSIYLCEYRPQFFAIFGKKVKELFPLLLTLFRQGSLQIRCQTTKILGNILYVAPEQITAELTAGITASFQPMWEPCISALVLNFPKYLNVIDPLIAEISTPSRTALSILCIKKIAEQDFSIRKIGQCLIDGLEHTEDSIRAVCIQAIGKALPKHPECIQILLNSMIEHANQTVLYLDALEPLIPEHPEIVNKLLEYTTTSGSIRSDIITTLKKYTKQYPEIVNQTLILFQNENISNRTKKECAEILAEYINTNSEVPIQMLNGLSHIDDAVRTICCQALEQLTTITNELARRILDKIAKIGTYELDICIKLLIKAGRTIVRDLINGLQNDDSDVRRVCANVLPKIGWRPMTDEYRVRFYFAMQRWDNLLDFKDLAISIARVGIKDSHWEFRQITIEFFKKLGLRILNQIQDVTRTTSIPPSFLNNQLKFGIIIPLTQGLGDWRREVREAAISALIAIGPVCISFVANLLSSPFAKAEDMKKILIALGPSSLPAVVNKMITISGRNRREICIDIIRSFPNGKQMAIEQLTRRLNDEKDQIRRNCAICLEAFQDPN